MKALCDAADLDCVSVSRLRYESQEISWALLITADIPQQSYKKLQWKLI